MGQTQQGSSVVDHGLLPFRRSVTCAVEVPISFAEVERAARICLAKLVTDSLSPSAERRPGTVASTVRGSRVLKVAVDHAVSSVRRRPGAVGHVHWHARRHGRIFPVMEADLLARPLSGGRTQLVVDGTYRPPGGPLGVVGDVLFGRIVARSTAMHFTGRLAQLMTEAVRGGRCGAWAAPTTSSEAA